MTRKITRRDALKGAAGIGLATAFPMPSIATAQGTLELRWLGWEHYNVRELTQAFEEEFNCRVSAGFFDGNSEAYNMLRAGGTSDFDLVMADGFWPRLYARQGLTQPLDDSKLDLGNAAHLARKKMDAEMHRRCAAAVPGDTHRNLYVQSDYSAQTFKHILVPVWLLSYTFHGKPFQVVINGYTGAIAGRYPKSWLKITLVAGAVIAVIAAFLWLRSR